MAEPQPGRPAPDPTDDRTAAYAADDTGERAEAYDADRADDRTGSFDPDGRGDRTAAHSVDDAAATRPVETDRDTSVPRPTQQQPVMEPAAASTPEAPKRHGNRLVGTLWVLLAAGLFQVVYVAAVAGLVALLAGPQVVGAQLAQYATTPFAWLPVLFFFLLFELTVLIFNRAGRFLYVVASLVVGVLVYVLSVLLITSLLRGSVGDRATLEQAFLSPLFVLTGLVAREVMLWTGVAIGARGTRLRKRDRAARDSYRAELREQHAA